MTQGLVLSADWLLRRGRAMLSEELPPPTLQGTSTSEVAS